MEKSKAISTVSNIVFVLAFVFSTSFLLCKPETDGFFASSSALMIVIKIFLALVFSGGATYFCFKANNNFNFMTLAGPIIIVAQSIFLTIDHYTSQLYGDDNEYLALHVLFLIVSISAFAVTGSTINKSFPVSSYNDFLKMFNISAILCYVLLIFVFLLKTPQQGSFSGDLNKNLGEGVITELRAFIVTHNLNHAYAFFGNIFFFSPLGYIVTYYLRKKEAYVPLLVGFAVIVLIEVYQYTGNCGNVDVDELVLNSIGFLFGFAACKFL